MVGAVVRELSAEEKESIQQARTLRFRLHEVSLVVCVNTWSMSAVETCSMLNEMLGWQNCKEYLADWAIDIT
jgi:hypothetical protein